MGQSCTTCPLTAAVSRRLPGEVGGQLLGHVDDVLLGAELVLLAEHVLQVDLVLVEQGLHPRAVLAGEADAQRGEDIRHDLSGIEWVVLLSKSLFYGDESGLA